MKPATPRTNALRAVHPVKYPEMGMAASLLREYDESHERLEAERQQLVEALRTMVGDESSAHPSHKVESRALLRSLGEEV